VDKDYIHEELMESNTDNTLEQFLERYPEHIRELVLSVRALILSVMPGTIEQFDIPANLVAYGLDRTYKGLICGIAIYKNYINIMLARGASLPDPEGLLRGTGKKARHIKIQQATDLDAPGVRVMLENALQSMGSVANL
jgi:hypothetical protein